MLAQLFSVTEHQDKVGTVSVVKGEEEYKEHLIGHLCDFRYHDNSNENIKLMYALRLVIGIIRLELNEPETLGKTRTAN